MKGNGIKSFVVLLSGPIHRLKIVPKPNRMEWNTKVAKRYFSMLRFDI